MKSYTSQQPTPVAQSYRMVILGWRPALLNELMRAHHFKRAQMKRNDTMQIIAAMLIFGVPLAKDKRRVRIEITSPFRGGFPDPDAPLKSCLDALKRACAIVDDSAIWCEWSVPQFFKGPKQTVITLEDVEG